MRSSLVPDVFGGNMDTPEMKPGATCYLQVNVSGALFSVAEAASGAAFIGAFLERMGEITPLAKSASIDYRKIAKGPIVATGTLSEEKAALLERLDADGRVEFTIDVSLRDGDDVEVATTTVAWHVRKKD